MASLLVVVNDRISDIVAKGEYTPRYYNPGELFDEVHILMANDDHPAPALLQKTVGRARLYLHKLPLPSFVKTLGWQPILLRNWLEEGVDLARQIQPALIRCYGFHVHSYLAAHIKNRLTVPAIVSLHGNPDVDYGRLAHTLSKKAAFWCWKRLAEQSLAAFDHCIAVYSPIKPFLESRQVKNYSIIYNTVGLGAIPKNNYQLKNGIVKCICVGRQKTEEKDQRDIIRAIAQLKNITLHLYGNGNLHDDLVALAKSLGVDHQIIFKEAIPNEDLMKILHKFDIYVYHSINAEISKTVIEAALIGLPIIHNVRKPYLSEELRGDYIYKVEDSIAGYRDGIATLAQDQALRRRLGESARAHAQSYWRPELTESQVVQLYQSLVLPQDEGMGGEDRELPLIPWHGHTLDGFFRCPVCQGALAGLTPDRWECGRCGQVYPIIQGIPVLVRSWREHEKTLVAACADKPAWYQEVQPAEEASPWRHHLKKRCRYVMRAIEGYLQDIGRSRARSLLDLGCGDGHHLHYLKNYTDRAFGSDYNLVRLVRAQQRMATAALFLADILDFPVQNDFFEIIFCNHVLEHIVEDEWALASVYRILKPGGLLILGVPNEGSWWWQLAYKLQPHTLKTTDHVHFYTAAAISRKLMSQGFHLLEIEHLGWGPPHWTMDAWLRRFKLMDDLWELAGKRLFPGQASSLYILATKP